MEVCLTTAKGQFIASVPSGVSTGEHEAVEVPAKEAIKKIAAIEPLLASREFSSQKEFDCFLIKQDGTKNKSRLGANTTLALSIAFCRALADEQGLPLYRYIDISIYRHIDISTYRLPRPCVLLFEGGKHGVAGGGLTFQEILLAPQGNSFQEMLDKAKAVFAGLRGQLSYPLGMEGGLVATSLRRHRESAGRLIKEEEILGLISQHTTEQIAVDVAASSFFSNGRYNFQGKEISADGLSDFYQDLIRKYNFAFIEDPFAQDDYSSWQKFRRHRESVELVGDDLTATNIERIKMANEQNLCNGVIIKPNQIGTVWETIEAAQMAKKFGWQIIVSHRAGETMDSFIADLAVGIGADFIKAGGLTQSARMAKYSRLLEIEKIIDPVYGKIP